MATPRRERLVAPLVSRPVGFCLPCRNPERSDASDLAELMLDAYRGTTDAARDETLADAERVYARLGFREVSAR